MPRFIPPVDLRYNPEEDNWQDYQEDPIYMDSVANRQYILETVLRPEIDYPTHDFPTHGEYVEKQVEWRNWVVTGNLPAHEPESPEEFQDTMTSLYLDLPVYLRPPPPPPPPEFMEWLLAPLQELPPPPPPPPPPQAPPTPPR